MAPPKGQFGNRLDTARGRAKEAQMQAAAAAQQSAAAPAPAPAQQITLPDGNTITVPFGMESGGFTGDGTPILNFTEQGGPPPGGGPPPPADVGDGLSSYERELLKRDKDDRDARNTQDRATASSFLRGILEQYGMGSLASQVESLIGTWGNNTAVIAENLRKTQEYRTRFKGLVGLQERGVTDIRNEAEYLDLETNYRSVFREAGLRDFLGQSGTQSEYDSIADLIGKFSLSVNEVRNRVSDAVRVVESNPQVRDAMQRFYGVDPQTLVAYTLDPSRTQNRINQIANAAMVGGYAASAGLNVGVGGAERFAGIAGDQDLASGPLQQQLAQAREVRDATTRLANIEQTALSDEDVVLAGADVDLDAQKKIRTLQSRERARFGGSSGLTTRSLAGGSGI